MITARDHIHIFKMVIKQFQIVAYNATNMIIAFIIKMRLLTGPKNIHLKSSFSTFAVDSSGVGTSTSADVSAITPAILKLLFCSF